jgi:hypothetical protein
MACDLHSIRLRNTLWLFEAYKKQVAPGSPDLHGLSKAFSVFIGISPSYWARMKGPNPLKNIGDLLARKIERKFGFPAGWLDKDNALMPELPEQVVASTQDLDELGFLQAALNIYRLKPRAAIAWVNRQKKETKSDQS